MRVILSAAVLPPGALAELKDWLGITTSSDDSELNALLGTALEVCADFTGLIPIACTGEEMLPSPARASALPEPCAWQQRRYPADWCPNPWAPGWQMLATRPVTAVTGIDAVAVTGARATLDAADYEIEITAEGAARIRLGDPAASLRYAVRFSAGLAADWDHLPQALRHGIIRLAAHQHRTRETPGASPLPPASVTALWQPWRRMRLA